MGDLTLLVDAGPLYAAADGRDRHHAACRELLATAAGPLLVPTLVIAEVACLLGRRLGAEFETRFIGDFAVGNLILEPLHPADLLRIAELVWRFRDANLGAVDASIVAAAERLGTTRVATLDRRHFDMVRPRHAPSWELLP